MRNSVAVLLVALMATPLFAVRPRPLSDFRFEDVPPVFVCAAASDGRDFLIAGSTADDFLRVADPSVSNVFVQHVVGGVPSGRRRFVAPGLPTSLLWTGDHYLMAWTTDSAVFVAPLSREGSLLTTPASPVLSSRAAGRLAVNGSAVVVVGGDQVRRLDTAGRPAGPTRALPVPKGGTFDSVAAVGDGFIAAFSGVGSTSVVRFDRDGAAAVPAETAIETYSQLSPDKYRSEGAMIGCAADRCVVVFEVYLLNGESRLKAAVIDGAGNLLRPPQLLATMAGERSLVPEAMTSDGLSFTVVVSVSHDPSGNFTDVDPALLRVSSDGERIDDLTYVLKAPRRQIATALAFNGHDLLMPWYDVTNQDFYGSWLATVPQATMQASAPQQIGRGLDAQSNLAIGTVNGQRLAAWIERAGATPTVRASRIDAAGNYLDGAGIVLGSTPVPERYQRGPTVSVAGNGASWLVVWADGQIRGVRLTFAGVPVDSAPVGFGSGWEAAARWDGRNYLVVFSDGSLYSMQMTADGRVLEPKTLASAQSSGSSSHTFTSPAIATLNGRSLVVAAAHDAEASFPFPGWSDNVSAVGMRLDETGAAIDATPFTIGAPPWSLGPAVETDGANYLVVWAKESELTGVLLSGTQAQLGGNPFKIGSGASAPAVAFDGRDYIVTWLRTVDSQTSIAATRVSAGAVGPVSIMPLDAGETVSDDLAVAASPSMPPLIAFGTRHPAYGAVTRAGLLFAAELVPAAAVPPVPSILDATRVGADTLAVRWQPVQGALGMAMELRLGDGTWASIGVAAGDATSGRAALGGLTGTAVRVRSWNGTGTSAPSAEVPIRPARVRTVRP